MFYNPDAITLESLNNKHLERRRNQRRADLTSKKPISKINYLLPYFEGNFKDDCSERIALDIERYVKETRRHKRETALFLESVRNRILYLHNYNLKIAQVAEYPFSNNFRRLLLQYVNLECKVLYKKEREYIITKSEKLTTDRILRLLLNIYQAYYEKKLVPPDKIMRQCSAAIIRLLCVDLRDQFDLKNKVIEKVCEKLLKKTGDYEKIEALVGQSLPCPLDTFFSSPDVEACKNIITSDYGTDDGSPRGNRIDDDIEIMHENDETCSNSNTWRVKSEDENDDVIIVSSDPAELRTTENSVHSKKVPTLCLDDDSKIGTFCWSDEVKISEKSKKLLENIDSKERDRQQKSRSRRQKQDQMFATHKPFVDVQNSQIKSEPNIIDLDSSEDESTSNSANNSKFNVNNKTFSVNLSKNETKSDGSSVKTNKKGSSDANQKSTENISCLASLVPDNLTERFSKEAVIIIEDETDSDASVTDPKSGSSSSITTIIDDNLTDTCNSSKSPESGYGSQELPLKDVLILETLSPSNDISTSPNGNQKEINKKLLSDIDFALEDLRNISISQKVVSSENSMRVIIDEIELFEDPENLCVGTSGKHGNDNQSVVDKNHPDGSTTRVKSNTNSESFEEENDPKHNHNSHNLEIVAKCSETSKKSNVINLEYSKEQMKSPVQEVQEEVRIEASSESSEVDDGKNENYPKQQVYPHDSKTIKEDFCEVPKNICHEEMKSTANNLEYSQEETKNQDLEIVEEIVTISEVTKIEDVPESSEGNVNQNDIDPKLNFRIITEISSEVPKHIFREEQALDIKNLEYLVEQTKTQEQEVIEEIVTIPELEEHETIIEPSELNDHLNSGNIEIIEEQSIESPNHIFEETKKSDANSIEYCEEQSKYQDQEVVKEIITISEHDTIVVDTLESSGEHSSTNEINPEQHLHDFEAITQLSSTAPRNIVHEKQKSNADNLIYFEEETKSQDQEVVEEIVTISELDEHVTIIEDYPNSEEHVSENEINQKDHINSENVETIVEQPSETPKYGFQETQKSENILEYFEEQTENQDQEVVEEIVTFPLEEHESIIENSPQSVETSIENKIGLEHKTVTEENDETGKEMQQQIPASDCIKSIEELEPTIEQSEHLNFNIGKNDTEGISENENNYREIEVNIESNSKTNEEKSKNLLHNNDSQITSNEIIAPTEKQENILHSICTVPSTNEDSLTTSIENTENVGSQDVTPNIPDSEMVLESLSVIDTVEDLSTFNSQSSVENISNEELSSSIAKHEESSVNLSEKREDKRHLDANIPTQKIEDRNEYLRENMEKELEIISEIEITSSLHLTEDIKNSESPDVTYKLNKNEIKNDKNVHEINVDEKNYEKDSCKIDEVVSKTPIDKNECQSISSKTVVSIVKEENKKTAERRNKAKNEKLKRQSIDDLFDQFCKEKELPKESEKSLTGPIEHTDNVKRDVSNTEGIKDLRVEKSKEATVILKESRKKSQQTKNKIIHNEKKGVKILESLKNIEAKQNKKSSVELIEIQERVLDDSSETRSASKLDKQHIGQSTTDGKSNISSDPKKYSNDLKQEIENTKKVCFVKLVCMDFGKNRGDSISNENNSNKIQTLGNESISCPVPLELSSENINVEKDLTLPYHKYQGPVGKKLINDDNEYINNLEATNHINQQDTYLPEQVENVELNKERISEKTLEKLDTGQPDKCTTLETSDIFETSVDESGKKNGSEDLINVENPNELDDAKIKEGIEYVEHEAGSNIDQTPKKENIGETVGKHQIEIYSVNDASKQPETEVPEFENVNVNEEELSVDVYANNQKVVVERSPVFDVTPKETVKDSNENVFKCSEGFHNVDDRDSEIICDLNIQKEEIVTEVDLEIEIPDSQPIEQSKTMEKVEPLLVLPPEADPLYIPDEKLDHEQYKLTALPEIPPHLPIIQDDDGNLDLLATVALRKRRGRPKGKKNTINNVGNKRITRSACQKSPVAENNFIPADFLHSSNSAISPRAVDIYTQRSAEPIITSEESNDSEGNHLLIDEDMHIKKVENDEAQEPIFVSSIPNDYDADTLDENLQSQYDPLIQILPEDDSTTKIEYSFTPNCSESNYSQISKRFSTKAEVKFIADDLPLPEFLDEMPLSKRLKEKSKRQIETKQVKKYKPEEEVKLKKHRNKIKSNSKKGTKKSEIKTEKTKSVVFVSVQNFDSKSNVITKPIDSVVDTIEKSVPIKNDPENITVTRLDINISQPKMPAKIRRKSVGNDNLNKSKPVDLDVTKYYLTPRLRVKNCKNEQYFDKCKDTVGPTTEKLRIRLDFCSPESTVNKFEQSAPVLTCPTSTVEVSNSSSVQEYVHALTTDDSERTNMPEAANKIVLNSNDNEKELNVIQPQTIDNLKKSLPEFTETSAVKCEDSERKFKKGKNKRSINEAPSETVKVDNSQIAICSNKNNSLFSTSFTEYQMINTDKLDINEVIKDESEVAITKNVINKYLKGTEKQSIENSSGRKKKSIRKPAVEPIELRDSKLEFVISSTEPKSCVEDRNEDQQKSVSGNSTFSRMESEQSRSENVECLSTKETVLDVPVKNSLRKDLVASVKKSVKNVAFKKLPEIKNIDMKTEDHTTDMDSNPTKGVIPTEDMKENPVSLLEKRSLRARSKSGVFDIELKSIETGMQDNVQKEKKLETNGATEKRSLRAKSKCAIIDTENLENLGTSTQDIIYKEKDSDTNAVVEKRSLRTRSKSTVMNTENLYNFETSVPEDVQKEKDLDTNAAADKRSLRARFKTIITATENLENLDTSIKENICKEKGSLANVTADSVANVTAEKRSLRGRSKSIVLDTENSENFESGIQDVPKDEHLDTNGSVEKKSLRVRSKNIVPDTENLDKIETTIPDVEKETDLDTNAKTEKRSLRARSKSLVPDSENLDKIEASMPKVAQKEEDLDKKSLRARSKSILLDTETLDKIETSMLEDAQKEKDADKNATTNKRSLRARSKSIVLDTETLDKIEPSMSEDVEKEKDYDKNGTHDKRSLRTRSINIVPETENLEKIETNMPEDVQKEKELDRNAATDKRSLRARSKSTGIDTTTLDKIETSMPEDGQNEKDSDTNATIDKRSLRARPRNKVRDTENLDKIVTSMSEDVQKEKELDTNATTNKKPVRARSKSLVPDSENVDKIEPSMSEVAQKEEVLDTNATTDKKSVRGRSKSILLETETLDNIETSTPEDVQKEKDSNRNGTHDKRSLRARSKSILLETETLDKIETSMPEDVQKELDKNATTDKRSLRARSKNIVPDTKNSDKTETIILEEVQNENELDTNTTTDKRSLRTRSKSTGIDTTTLDKIETSMPDDQKEKDCDTNAIDKRSLRARPKNKVRDTENLDKIMPEDVQSENELDTNATTDKRSLRARSKSLVPDSENVDKIEACMPEVVQKEEELDTNTTTDKKSVKARSQSVVLDTETFDKIETSMPEDVQNEKDDTNTTTDKRSLRARSKNRVPDIENSDKIETIIPEEVQTENELDTNTTTDKRSLRARSKSIVLDTGYLDKIETSKPEDVQKEKELETNTSADKRSLRARSKSTVPDTENSESVHKKLSKHSLTKEEESQKEYLKISNVKKSLRTRSKSITFEQVSDCEPKHEQFEINEGDDLSVKVNTTADGLQDNLVPTPDVKLPLSILEQADGELLKTPSRIIAFDERIKHETATTISDSLQEVNVPEKNTGSVSSLNVLPTCDETLPSSTAEDTDYKCEEAKIPSKRTRSKSTVFDELSKHDVDIKIESLKQDSMKKSFRIRSISAADPLAASSMKKKIRNRFKNLTKEISDSMEETETLQKVDQENCQKQENVKVLLEESCKSVIFLRDSHKSNKLLAKDYKSKLKENLTKSKKKSLKTWSKTVTFQHLSELDLENENSKIKVENEVSKETNLKVPCDKEDLAKDSSVSSVTKVRARSTSNIVEYGSEEEKRFDEDPLLLSNEKRSLRARSKSVCFDNLNSIEETETKESGKLRLNEDLEKYSSLDQIVAESGMVGCEEKIVSDIESEKDPDHKAANLVANELENQAKKSEKLEKQSLSSLTLKESSGRTLKSSIIKESEPENKTTELETLEDLQNLTVATQSQDFAAKPSAVPNVERQENLEQPAHVNKKIKKSHSEIITADTSEVVDILPDLHMSDNNIESDIKRVTSKMEICHDADANDTISEKFNLEANVSQNLDQLVTVMPSMSSSKAFDQGHSNSEKLEIQKHVPEFEKTKDILELTTESSSSDFHQDKLYKTQTVENVLEEIPSAEVETPTSSGFEPQKHRDLLKSTGTPSVQAVVEASAASAMGSLPQEKIKISTISDKNSILVALLANANVKGVETNTGLEQSLEQIVDINLTKVDVSQSTEENKIISTELEVTETIAKTSKVSKNSSNINIKDITDDSTSDKCDRKNPPEVIANHMKHEDFAGQEVIFSAIETLRTESDSIIIIGNEKNEVRTDKEIKSRTKKSQKKEVVKLEKDLLSASNMKKKIRNRFRNLALKEVLESDDTTQKLQSDEEDREKIEQDSTDTAKPVPVSSKFEKKLSEVESEINPNEKIESTENKSQFKECKNQNLRRNSVPLLTTKEPFRPRSTSSVFKQLTEPEQVTKSSEIESLDNGQSSIIQTRSQAIALQLAAQPNVEIYEDFKKSVHASKKAKKSSKSLVKNEEKKKKRSSHPEITSAEATVVEDTFQNLPTTDTSSRSNIEILENLDKLCTTSTSESLDQLVSVNSMLIPNEDLDKGTIEPTTISKELEIQSHLQKSEKIETVLFVGSPRKHTLDLYEDADLHKPQQIKNNLDEIPNSSIEMIVTGDAEKESNEPSGAQEAFKSDPRISEITEPSILPSCGDSTSTEPHHKTSVENSNGEYMNILEQTSLKEIPSVHSTEMHVSSFNENSEMSVQLGIVEPPSEILNYKSSSKLSNENCSDTYLSKDSISDRYDTTSYKSEQTVGHQSLEVQIPENALQVSASPAVHYDPIVSKRQENVHPLDYSVTKLDTPSLLSMDTCSNNIPDISKHNQEILSSPDINEKSISVVEEVSVCASAESTKEPLTDKKQISNDETVIVKNKEIIEDEKPIETPELNFIVSSSSLIEKLQFPEKVSIEQFSPKKIETKSETVTYTKVNVHHKTENVSSVVKKAEHDILKLNNKNISLKQFRTNEFVNRKGKKIVVKARDRILTRKKAVDWNELTKDLDNKHIDSHIYLKEIPKKDVKTQETVLVPDVEKPATLEIKHLDPLTIKTYIPEREVSKPLVSDLLTIDHNALQMLAGDSTQVSEEIIPQNISVNDLQDFDTKNMHCSQISPRKRERKTLGTIISQLTEKTNIPPSAEEFKEPNINMDNLEANNSKYAQMIHTTNTSAVPSTKNADSKNADNNNKQTVQSDSDVPEIHSEIEVTSSDSFSPIKSTTDNADSHIDNFSMSNANNFAYNTKTQCISDTPIFNTPIEKPDTKLNRNNLCVKDSVINSYIELPTTRSATISDVFESTTPIISNVSKELTENFPLTNSSEYVGNANVPHHDNSGSFKMTHDMILKDTMDFHQHSNVPNENSGLGLQTPILNNVPELTRMIREVLTSRAMDMLGCEVSTVDLQLLNDHISNNTDVSLLFVAESSNEIDDVVPQSYGERTPNRVTIECTGDHTYHLGDGPGGPLLSTTSHSNILSSHNFDKKPYVNQPLDFNNELEPMVSKEICPNEPNESATSDQYLTNCSLSDFENINMNETMTFDFSTTGDNTDRKKLDIANVPIIENESPTKSWPFAPDFTNPKVVVIRNESWNDPCLTPPHSDASDFIGSFSMRSCESLPSCESIQSSESNLGSESNPGSVNSEPCQSPKHSPEKVIPKEKPKKSTSNYAPVRTYGKTRVYPQRKPIKNKEPEAKKTEEVAPPIITPSIQVKTDSSNLNVGVKRKHENDESVETLNSKLTAKSKNYKVLLTGSHISVIPEAQIAPNKICNSKENSLPALTDFDDKEIVEYHKPKTKIYTTSSSVQPVLEAPAATSTVSAPEVPPAKKTKTVVLQCKPQLIASTKEKSNVPISNKILIEPSEKISDISSNELTDKKLESTPSLLVSEQADKIVSKSLEDKWSKDLTLVSNVAYGVKSRKRKNNVRYSDDPYSHIFIDSIDTKKSYLNCTTTKSKISKKLTEANLPSAPSREEIVEKDSLFKVKKTAVKSPKVKKISDNKVTIVYEEVVPATETQILPLPLSASPPETDKSQAKSKKCKRSSEDKDQEVRSSSKLPDTQECKTKETVDLHKINNQHRSLSLTDNLLNLQTKIRDTEKTNDHEKTQTSKYPNNHSIDSILNRDKHPKGDKPLSKPIIKAYRTEESNSTKRSSSGRDDDPFDKLVRDGNLNENYIIVKEHDKLKLRNNVTTKPDLRKDRERDRRSSEHPDPYRDSYGSSMQQINSRRSNPQPSSWHQQHADRNPNYRQRGQQHHLMQKPYRSLPHANFTARQRHSEPHHLSRTSSLVTRHSTVSAYPPSLGSWIASGSYGKHNVQERSRNSATDKERATNHDRDSKGDDEWRKKIEDSAAREFLYTGSNIPQFRPTKPHK